MIAAKEEATESRVPNYWVEVVTYKVAEYLCHEWSFPRLWRMTGFVSWQVSLVEQELITLPLNSGFLWGSFCTVFSYMHSMLWIIVCSFGFFFILVIVLSVLRFTASDINSSFSENPSFGNFLFKLLQCYMIAKCIY